MAEFSPTILVFDLGTTFFKAMMVGLDGEVLATVRVATPVQSPKPGWSQIEVADFDAALDRLAAQLRQIDSAMLSRLAAITFASQTNSFLLLDQQFHPLTPIILWNDARACDIAQTVCEPLNQLADRYATTGVWRLDGQFAVAKLHWLSRNQPQAFGQAAKFCLISDWLTRQLTGRHLTEAGAAGLTGLVDVHSLDWWPQALHTAHIPRDWLPKVVRAGFDAGTIVREQAKRFAFPADCRFIIGCLDQYAGAIGLGNVFPGGISETTGTVLATIRCSDTWTEDGEQAGIFQGPGFRAGVWLQMAVSDVSANWLQRYRDQQPDAPTFAELDERAAQVVAGAEGLRCTGMQNGELRFEGRTARHGRGHEVRAILEAVAWALRRQVQVLAGDDWPKVVYCAGGAARSPLWQQIKSEALGCPAEPSALEEPTCYGAARLAIAGIGGDSINAWANALQRRA